MKLVDWINFHEENKLLNCDLIVTGIKQGSLETKDIILTTTLHLDRAKQLFGNYELMKVRTDKRLNSDGYGMGVLVAIPDIV